LAGDSSEDQVVIKTTKVIEKASTTGMSDYLVIIFANFIGLHHVEQVYIKRREKFLNEIRTLTHAVLHSLTGQSY